MSNKPTYEELERKVKEFEQTEKALKESELFLSSLLHQSPYPTWVSDRSGLLVEANPALYKLLNLTKEQLVNVYNVFDDPQIAEDLKDRIHKVFDEGIITDFDMEWAGEDTGVDVLKDSNRVFIEGVSFPVRNANDEIINAICTYRDVSERKIAELKLQESERKYRLLVNSIDGGLSLIHKDGTYLFVNDVSSAVFDMNTEDMIGRNVRNIYSDSPDFLEKGLPLLNQVLSTGEGIEHERYVEEVDRWFYENIQPVQNEAGEHFAVQVLTTDITERKQIEEALLESEKFHRQLMDSTSDGYFDHNLITDEVFYGRRCEEMLGYAPGKIKHHLSSWQSLLYPDDVPEIEKKVADLVEGKMERFVQEYRLRNKTESWQWLLSRAKIVEWDENGNATRLVGTHQDITKRKQAEEKIKANLKEKETLLQEIHHRVKNNMQVVSSLLKLQSDNIEDNQIKEILKASQSRVYAMSAVHETLHGSENLSEIDLKSYLSKIANSIFQTYSISPNKVTLNIDIEGIPIGINQASPLGLVINELISNSLKYAFPEDKQGEITVSIRKLDKELELIMKDDGIGIPDDLDWKNSSTLGLRLVRTLVENQLDGTIDIENANGTKFTIKINLET